MPALLVEGAVKEFGDAKTRIRALDDVSLSIGEGEILGLLGPNGAGKTTLISAICGLVELDCGKIRVFGKDALKEKEKVSSDLNLITGFAGLLQGLSVEKLLMYYCQLYNVSDKKAAIENALTQTGLREKRAQAAQTLSSGYKQRFYIAKALLSDPKLLLMDEPTVGLDVKSAMSVRALVKNLRRSGKTILLTTHYMREAEELCDRIALISHGKITAIGTVAQLRKKAGIKKGGLEEVFLELTKEELGEDDE